MGFVATARAVALLQVWRRSGYFQCLWDFVRQFYLSIPRELEEAAIIDGAGYWRVYWQIVLPLSRPILATLFVFFFLANWNAFSLAFDYHPRL